jgi:nitric oxide reductase subunit C
MINKGNKNILVLLALVTVFCVYNLIIYTHNDRKNPIKLEPDALRGQQLWQNNNCWSCHQVYGLGGYLGPDLTNIYSIPNKGPQYIKAFLNSGVKSMPKFDFSDTEKDDIVAYLKYIDSTGYYPNYDAKFKATGWVELKYKNEK